MSNKWLFHQLKGLDDIYIQPSYKPLIVVSKNGREYRIYTPTPDEYIISVDLVKKVIDLGGNTLSYADSWCRSSLAAKEYGKDNSVIVVSHGELFKKIDHG